MSERLSVAQLLSFHTLGVINVTPNSFSDQGLTHLDDFLNRTEVIIDFGFESTAPMNKAISEQSEMERFESFLLEVKKLNFKNKIISFDTYRPRNFLKMQKRFSDEHGPCQFIFNDVSGLLDEELFEVLGQSDCLYIYNSAHISSRDHVLDHMKFLSNNDVVAETLLAFKQAIELFDQHGMRDRLILDPGFGFSKTYEQNWGLINRFSELVKGLEDLKIESPLLIGLSKKSFLRKALDTDSFLLSEHLHFKVLVDLLRTRTQAMLFRVHNPDIVAAARKFCL